jgi:hypothetical protein
MKLSQLSEKNIYVNKTFKGVCRGVAISLKSHAVRYLLCASTSTQSVSDFAIGIAAVADINESITLTRLRPACPKGCAKIAIGLPVYSFEGGYLGVVTDLDIRDFVATKLYTDRGESFPILSVFACSDAVILRKKQPFPLGQRIPAPLLPVFTNKTDGIITKPVLRAATAKGALIRLTLALPPFQLETEHLI